MPDPIPVSAVRIPLDLKTAAAAKARDDGRTLTSVIIEALRQYVSS